jgi:hypothetical protein
MEHLLIISEGAASLDRGFDGAGRGKTWTEVEVPAVTAPRVRGPSLPPTREEKENWIVHGLYAFQIVSSMIGGLALGGLAGWIAVGIGLLVVAAVVGGLF